MPIILLSSLSLREKSVKINLNKAAIHVCRLCLWVTWALRVLVITYCILKYIGWRYLWCILIKDCVVFQGSERLNLFILAKSL
jgi:hypothetical protein